MSGGAENSAGDDDADDASPGAAGAMYGDVTTARPGRCLRPPPPPARVVGGAAAAVAVGGYDCDTARAGEMHSGAS
jgi:hypothetical protein